MLKIVLCLCFVSATMFGQERIHLYGSIKGNGTLENIHVLNKNSTQGTITDQFGRFQIKAMVSDTLIVSGIQFYYQEVVITEDHITNKTIPVHLLQRINELDEITLKSHQLSGFLQLDAANAKDSISKVNKGALDFSGIDLSTPYVGPVDEINRRKPPNPFGPNNNIPGFSDSGIAGGGGDVLALVGFVLSPVINAIDKIGETKRKNNRRNKFEALKLDQAPEQLIERYAEYLMVELHLPKAQLKAFVAHCQTHAIFSLFIEDKQIEVLDILIREAPLFLDKIKTNKL